MEQKEIRLNGGKRKSLIIDYRKHWESQPSEEKEDFDQSRERAEETINSSLAFM